MRQIEKARNEIAINQIDETHPKKENGRRECTWSNPMPLAAKKGYGPWEHPEDAIKEDGDSDYYIAYKCHACGHRWKEEMPD